MQLTKCKVSSVKLWVKQLRYRKRLPANLVLQRWSRTNKNVSATIQSIFSSFISADFKTSIRPTESETPPLSWTVLRLHR